MLYFVKEQNKVKIKSTVEEQCYGENEEACEAEGTKARPLLNFSFKRQKSAQNGGPAGKGP